MWALLFLSVFCGCCYTTLERILYYASAPTATTVSTVHVHSIQFPAVTATQIPSENHTLMKITSLDLFSLHFSLKLQIPPITIKNSVVSIK